MISAEHVMPVEERLDFAIGECADLIKGELDDMVTETVFGEIIDWTQVDDTKIDLANKFVKLIGANDEPERESMVRGAFFARQVLHMVYADNVSLPLAEYCGTLDVYELRMKLDQDVEEYLASRPNVAQLIQESLPALDVHGTYGEATTKTSAFIFMLAEFHMAEQYMDNALSALLSEAHE